jgi:hypothetical protein
MDENKDAPMTEGQSWNQLHLLIFLSYHTLRSRKGVKENSGHKSLERAGEG